MASILSAEGVVRTRSRPAGTAAAARSAASQRAPRRPAGGAPVGSVPD